jgi:hypothetical protein
MRSNIVLMLVNGTFSKKETFRDRSDHVVRCNSLQNFQKPGGWMNQVANTAGAWVLRRAQHRRGQFDILVMRLFERRSVNFDLKFNGFFGPGMTIPGSKNHDLIY